MVGVGKGGSAPLLPPFRTLRSPATPRAELKVTQIVRTFQNVTASDLGGAAISGALEDAKLRPDDIDELVMGCVLSAGQGQAPARQAGFRAGLGNAVPASTVNKMCGSDMKAVMTAFDQI